MRSPVNHFLACFKIVAYIKYSSMAGTTFMCPLSVNRYLNCFHFWAIRNTDMNILRIRKAVSFGNSV